MVDDVLCLDYYKFKKIIKLPEVTQCLGLVILVTQSQNNIRKSTNRCGYFLDKKIEKVLKKHRKCQSEQTTVLHTRLKANCECH